MAPSSFVIPWPVCTTNFPTRLPSTTSSTLSFCLLYIFSLLFKKEGYRKLMTTKDITRYYAFPSPHPRNTYAFSAKGRDKVDFWSITTWLCERKRHATHEQLSTFPPDFPLWFFFIQTKFLSKEKIYPDRFLLILMWCVCMLCVPSSHQLSAKRPCYLSPVTKKWFWRILLRVFLPSSISASEENSHFREKSYKLFVW